MPPPDLPSILPPSEGVQDSTTTLEQIKAAEQNGKITEPEQTPIYICAFQGTTTLASLLVYPHTLADCFRLYPNYDRLMSHRKRDHNSDSDTDIITWNYDHI